MYWSLSGPASWLSVSLLGISCNPCADSTVKSNQLAGCDKNFMIEFFLDAISSSFFDFLQDSRLFISSKKHGRRELNSEEEQQLEGIPTRERHYHCETRESYYHPRSFRKKPHRRIRDTEPMDRILLWAGHSQDQWIAISTELSRQTQRMTTPSFTKK